MFPRRRRGGLYWRTPATQLNWTEWKTPHGGQARRAERCFKLKEGRSFLLVNYSFIHPLLLPCHVIMFMYVSQLMFCNVMGSGRDVMPTIYTESRCVCLALVTTEAEGRRRRHLSTVRSRRHERDRGIFGSVTLGEQMKGSWLIWQPRVHDRPTHHSNKRKVDICRPGQRKCGSCSSNIQAKRKLRPNCQRRCGCHGLERSAIQTFSPLISDIRYYLDFTQFQVGTKREQFIQNLKEMRKGRRKVKAKSPTWA